MKIVFLCAALEAGKDGVGDYTRRLAGACHAKGETVAIIAFNDHFIETRTDTDHPFKMIRIPKAIDRDTKTKLISSILRDIDPDWISIQFVPYALHPKGFVTGSIPFFKQITSGYHTQIMFHELWIGEELGCELKRKLVGKVQKWGIKKFIKSIRPDVIHTSIPLYQKMLSYKGIESKVLPLFGNIRINDRPQYEWIINAISGKTKNGINDANRSDYVIGGIFGKIYPNWDMDKIFEGLKKLHQGGKKIIFTSVGQLGNSVSLWDDYAQRFPFCKFISLGFQTEENVSSWMQYIDFGVAATPYILLGKSGSFIAMNEHGLPVICQKPDLSFKFDFTQSADYEGITIVTDDFAWDKVPPRLPQKPLLEDTAALFLLNLNHTINK